MAIYGHDYIIPCLNWGGKIAGLKSLFYGAILPL